MQVVVFTYNRERKVKNLLKKLQGYDVLVIDDGSEWSADKKKIPTGCTWIRTPHDGKKGMWRNWLIAHEIALSTEHNYFLFIADDITPKMKVFDELTKQGWHNNLFSIAPTNTGRYKEWGEHRTGFKEFKIGKYKFVETGFMDLGTFTNRKTLESFRVNEVPDNWFNTRGKSSGVGAQLTHKFRELGILMITTIPSISVHGNHKSVMHPDHRKLVPLKSV